MSIPVAAVPESRFRTASVPKILLPGAWPLRRASFRLALATLMVAGLGAWTPCRSGRSVAAEVGVPQLSVEQAPGTVLARSTAVGAWGGNSKGEAGVPGSLTGSQTVAAAGTRTVALKTNGTLVAWGSDDYNQTTVPAGLTGIQGV